MNSHVSEPRFMPNPALPYYISITFAHLLGGRLDFKCSTLCTLIVSLCNRANFITASMLWKKITKPQKKLLPQSMPTS